MKVNLINTYRKPFSKDTIAEVVQIFKERGIKVEINEQMVSSKSLTKFAGLILLNDSSVLKKKQVNIVYYNVPTLFKWTYKFLRAEIPDVYQINDVIYLTAYNRPQYLESAIKTGLK